MVADDRGLIHGGFIFSLADYAAMVVVNHPNVVLSKASFKFIKPVKVGDTIIATGKLDKEEGKKAVVKVDVKSGDQLVAMGSFNCFIPKTHVLEEMNK
ncbi:MAG: Thioesterase superfamily protein [Promethearchaeota archaeon]|nr:MAG: Thioesterase superfamily protein [Candidatus Lokiarchaeota archaeon]